jgi:hypothetical protein
VGDLRTSLAGSLGYFWPDGAIAKHAAEPIAGYLRMSNQWLSLQALDEDRTALLEDHFRNPTSISGLLVDGAVLLLETRLRSVTDAWGPGRASTKLFEARTAIGDVPLHRLRSPDLFALEAHLPQLTRWAGITAIDVRRTTDSEGRSTALTVEVASPPEEIVPLTGGRQLAFGTTWRFTGREDRPDVYAPVTFACRAAQPKPIWSLLQPLMYVQDLVNLAYQGFVAADGGGAVLDVSPPRDPDHDPRMRPLWNGLLMAAPDGVERPESMTQVPLFGLTTLGGLPSLARWIKLADMHPRAMRAVVGRYRIGRPTAEVSLMQTAAAIEYWVRAHQPARWTKRRGFYTALAARVGAPFAEWAGDIEKWGKAVADNNNTYKHNPDYLHDPQELSDLGWSGRMLLAAALLNRVAGSKLPSRTIFGGHALHNLGRRLRERYA